MTSYDACLDIESIQSPGEVKTAQRIEPLQDSRWDKFLLKHPRASVFHSSAWLEALSRTYGFQPFAYTTSSAGEDLENAIVACKVDSWLTGRRLVSLPFSDHCEPLVDKVEDRDLLMTAFEREVEQERSRYLEIRPIESFERVTSLPRTTIAYAFHKLDLGPDIHAIFGNLHKSSTQRKVHRARREGLRYREGSTKAHLDDFYRIFTLTRKRQGLAPQSKKWFANLMDCFGDALTIHAALHEERVIAAIIMIRYKDTLTYKYGCCDARFNNLGCMHLLFWNAIHEAKSSGLRCLDFGRTDADQQGLITFKNRWGATRTVLTYTRYGAVENSTHLFDLYGAKWKAKATKGILRHVPTALLPAIGQVLYKHIG